MLIIKVKNKNIEAALKTISTKFIRLSNYKTLIKIRSTPRIPRRKREEKKKAIYVNKKRNDL